jgi:hypothetical protein
MILHIIYGSSFSVFYQIHSEIQIGFYKQQDEILFG